MNKFLMLTRVLFKNGSNPYSSGANNKRKTLGLVLLGVCLIPFIFSTTAVIYALYGTLTKYGLDGVVLSGFMAATCVIMVVFGMLYVISIFYFVDDTVPLLTMPLKPEHILASKFVIVNVYQYLMEVFILLPCVLAFALRIHTVPFILYSVIILVTLPIVPTVVCAIISIVLMALGRFFHNKDRVKTITGLLGITIALAINFFIQSLSRGSSSQTAQMLLDKKELIAKATMIFPSSLFAANAMLDSATAAGFANLLLFLVISAAAVAVFLLLGKGLYLSGLVGLTQSSSSGRAISAVKFTKLTLRRPVMLTIALKDWKTLYRTPAYLLNCVLGGVLFPPLFAILYGFTSPIGALPFNAYVYMVIALILNFFCIFNLISPTAVSREGKDFYINRYIPVPAKTLILGKLLPGLLMSWFSLIVVCAVGYFVMKLSAVMLLMIFITSLFSLAAMNMAGLYIDIFFPKLEWDDETVAVKRNMNFLIEMLLVIVLFGLALVAEALFKMSIGAAFAVLTVLSIGLCAAAYSLLMTSGAKAFGSVRRGE